jgi:RNA polymerase-binding transcription factor DksA
MHTTLTRSQLREIRSQLERERQRSRRGDAWDDAVMAALRRIDDDRYGTCANCQRAIPYERLSVLPETLYCTDCARHAVAEKART